MISATGVIRWTPSEDQGPSANEFVTWVADDGVPALSATNRFTVGVSEVHQGPEIITQPPSNTVASIGSEVRLEIVVTGTLPFSYQWQFQGEDLLNGTNCLLLLTNVQTAQAGCYRVQVSNHVGSLWSEDAWLAVRQPTIPRIIEGSVVRLENGSFEFSISSDVGSHLEIQGSENLENWTRLTTLTNVTGTVTFTDRSTPNRSRFYRAKQVQ